MSSHARERAAWFLAALAAAVAAAAPGGAIPSKLVNVALAIATGIIPGAWLAGRLVGGQPSDVRASFALVASPFLSGAALVLVRFAGVAPVPAAQGVSVALALLAAWEALRPRAREHEAASTLAVWWVALGLGALLLAAHTVDPMLSARSDGAFHAGVVWSVERGLPPEDPFFAGLPLRYAWGIHAWAAGWLALAPRLGAYTPLVWSSVGAAIAAMLAVGSLARRLGGSPCSCVLAQVLALVGAAPFTWVTLAIRAATGHVRGTAELARSLDHGADEALRALDPGWLHPSLVLPLDKFVVLTPFAWGLAGGAAALLALAAWCETRSRASLAWMAVALAAVTFAHPFAGLALIAALAAGVGVAWVTEPAVKAVAPGAAAALLGSIVLVSPYLAALVSVGGGESGVPARLSVRAAGLLSTLLAGAVVLPPAARALLANRAQPAFARILVGAIGALALAACVVSLGGDNQSKFLNLAFLLASAPAALGWAGLGERARRVVAPLLVAALAPTLGAALWAYAHERATSHDAPSQPPLSIVAAVTEFVPRDGIIVDATQDTTRGAAPGLPGETGRTLLWSGGFMARKWGHASGALASRAVVARSLELGAWPVGRDADQLLALGRELWLIAPEEPARATDPRERVVARADGVRLVRWQSDPGSP